MNSSVRTRRFSIEEFHRMAEVGVLKEEDRVELIDGEIIPMTPIGPEHAACVDWLTRLLIQRVPADIVVHVQNPFQFPHHIALYPDLALLRPPTDRYRNRSPRPEDVLLVIEVSDTSLERDRAAKIPRYAEAGVPEVWLVDLSRQEVLIFRDPSGGQYRNSSTASGRASLSPAHLPNLAIQVEEIFS
ncbi:MAG: Uma2 family endonuclease [Nitrospiraceae bacterium]